MKRITAIFLSLLLLLTAAVPVSAGRQKGDGDNGSSQEAESESALSAENSPGIESESAGTESSDGTESDFSDIPLERYLLGIALTAGGQIIDFAKKDGGQLFASDPEVLYRIRNFGSGLSWVSSAKFYRFRQENAGEADTPAVSDALIRRVVSSAASGINAMLGTTTLAAASTLALSDSYYPCPCSFEGVAAIEVSYMGGRRLFFVFSGNGRGTVLASGMPVFFDQAVIEEYLEESFQNAFSAEGSLLNSAKIGIEVTDLVAAQAVYPENVEVVPATDAPSGEEELLEEAKRLAGDLGRKAANDNYLKLMNLPEEVWGLAAAYSILSQEPVIAFVSPASGTEDMFNRVFEEMLPADDRTLQGLLSSPVVKSRMTTAIPTILTSRAGASELSAASVIGNSSDAWLTDENTSQVYLLVYESENGERKACYVRYLKNDNGVLSATAVPMPVTFDIDEAVHFIESGEGEPDNEIFAAFSDWLREWKVIRFAEN